MIKRSIPWTSQPPPGTKLNSTWGVARLWYGNSSALGQPPATSFGTNGFRHVRYGISNDFSGGGNGSVRWVNSPGVPSTLTQGITLVAIASPDSIASEISVCGVSSTANNNPWVRLEFRPDLSNTWNLQYGGDGGSYTNVNGGTAAVGQVDILIGIWRPSTGEKSLWVNGVKKNSATTDRGTTTITQFEVGNLWRTTPTQHFDGAIPLAALINRAITDAEAATLSANPWLLFEPKTKTLNYSPSTSYTVTANYGTYTTTGQSATLLKSKVISASVGSYSITGQAATITYTPTGTNYTLVADKGDYTYTGQTATLLRSKLLNAVNGTYSVSGQNATLSYSGSNTVTLKAGSWLRYRIIQ